MTSSEDTFVHQGMLQNTCSIILQRILQEGAICAEDVREVLTTAGVYARDIPRFISNITVGSYLHPTRCDELAFATIVGLLESDGVWCLKILERAEGASYFCTPHLFLGGLINFVRRRKTAKPSIDD